MGSIVEWYATVVIKAMYTIMFRNWLTKIASASSVTWAPLASFTKEVNWRLAKRPLVYNGRLNNRQLTSLVKEANVMTSQTPSRFRGTSSVKLNDDIFFCPGRRVVLAGLVASTSRAIIETPLEYAKVRCHHTNDTMTWKRFPHCWPFVRGIHRHG